MAKNKEFRFDRLWLDTCRRSCLNVIVWNQGKRESVFLYPFLEKKYFKIKWKLALQKKGWISKKLCFSCVNFVALYTSNDLKFARSFFYFFPFRRCVLNLIFLCVHFACMNKLEFKRTHMKFGIQCSFQYQNHTIHAMH